MPIQEDLIKTTSSSVRFSLRTKTKERRMLRKAVSTLFPQNPKYFGCQGFSHMKQKCPTYLKTIRKSKALATTLSDTEPKDDSDNDDDEILNAFTTTVDPTYRGSEIVGDEDDLVDSKFKKMDDQDGIHTAYEKMDKVSKKHEKLYRLATKKLSDVELDREKLSIKFDEAN